MHPSVSYQLSRTFVDDRLRAASEPRRTRSHRLPVWRLATTIRPVRAPLRPARTR